MTPIYLMDASAFIHRAFHAVRNLSTRGGRPTGAVYGFAGTLLKLLRDQAPEALAVIFDSPEHGRRHEIYPAYKANRGPLDEDLKRQLPDTRRLVEALGLFSLERPGFEADDLIAAAARTFTAQGLEVVIVSSDKDFYQLLSEGVSMYDPDPKKDSALTLAAFQERFGLNPAAFLDMQALMGDSSDNIPGVPTVGEKTALKLISRFGTLDSLYARLEEVTPEKLRATLTAHREAAYLSRELASLGQGAIVDFEVQDLRPRPPDQNLLAALFAELEFTRLSRELPAVYSASQPEIRPQATPVTYDGYVLVDGPDGWKTLESALAGARALAVDLETDSLSPSRASLVGLSLCAEPGRAFYIPVGHRTLGAANQSRALERIGPWLTASTLPKIGQNAKFDWLVLARHGLELPPPSDDPMLASYLLDPEARHGLDYLSRRHLGHAPIAYKDLLPDPKKKFSDLSPEEARDYAAEDADLTFRLAGLLRASLNENQALAALYEEVELPLEALLANMEGAGILLDVQALERLSRELGGQLKVMEEKIFNLAGRAFNIASPRQLAEVLFKEQGLTPLKKTAKKTGFSTDDEVLSELALTHPLPRAIREWRSLDKLKSTYTDKLPRTVNPATGRVHTSYNQTQTATGRLSSSEPNLQNIPVRGEEGRRLREAFIAPPGFQLISADYSQIELRILAHFSGDEALIGAFSRDEDIHAQTAAEIFGLPAAEITADLRREAKTINFGVVYGQGAFALGKQLGRPQAQARDFIERYFQRFPGVRRYMEETRAAARDAGQVSTWFGRLRRLSGFSGGYQARQEAERMAINTPIQGTAADLIKMAMLAVAGRLKAEHPRARLLLQVHDELVVEAPEAEVQAVSELLKTEMAGVAAAPPLTGARPLTVPLKVEVGAGPNWAAAH
jgi:DNA polymerase-1